MLLLLAALLLLLLLLLLLPPLLAAGAAAGRLVPAAADSPRSCPLSRRVLITATCEKAVGTKVFQGSLL